MKRYLISAAILAAVGFSACDGNDETNPTDTVRPDTTDTTQPDTTDTIQPDTTPGDTIAPPDTVEPSATVKYARTLVAQEPCSADFRNDIDPQSQLADVIVTTPVYEITAPAAEDPGSYGFYVADAEGGAYSGILVVTDGPKPELAIGNVVDVSGQLMEAFCNAQVSNATVTKKSDGTLPTPLTQNAADLSQDAYEGMLVKVVDAEIEAATEGGQGKRIKGANLPIGFVFEGFIGLNNGTTYDITGVIRSTRFNGVEGFQLVPRGPSDVVAKTSGNFTAITAIQGGTDSTGCDTSCAGNVEQCATSYGDHEVRGVIATTSFKVANNLSGYYITDESTEPYSAILVTIANGNVGAHQPGDRVTVFGRHTEFYCMTQISATQITKTGDGGVIPAAINIDGKTFNELEQYEAMLVEVTNVTVSEFNSQFKEAKITNDLWIDELLGATAPAQATTLSSVRGHLRWSFNKYRISPRGNADIVATPAE